MDSKLFPADFGFARFAKAGLHRSMIIVHQPRPLPLEASPSGKDFPRDFELTKIHFDANCQSLGSTPDDRLPNHSLPKMKHKATISAAICAACILFTCLATLSAQTRTWDGDANNNLTNNNNWSNNTLPTNEQTAIWNGTQAGNLNLIFTTGIPTNNRLFNDATVAWQLTSDQTGSVTINAGGTGTARGDNVMRTNANGITVDAGAGALNVGTGGQIFDWRLNGQIASQNVTNTNNSSNAVTFGSNLIQIAAGGYDNRTLIFGGSGDWNLGASATRIRNQTDFANAYSGTRSGILGITKNGNGLLTLGSGNTIAGASTYTGNGSDFSGAVIVNGGTLRATSNTSLGIGAQVGTVAAGFSNQGTTVNAGATLDLFGNLTINEVVSLNNGASLINSSAATTAVLDSGIAGIELNARGSGYTNTAANGLTMGISGGGGSGAEIRFNVGIAGTGNPVDSVGAGNINNNTGAVSGQLTSAWLTSSGSGYTTAPTVTITSGAGTGATANAILTRLNLTGTTNQIGGAGNLTINAVVAGSGGGFQKVGAGTTTLSAANTYSGGTTINAGTLVLSSNTAAGTGSIVAAGGTGRVTSSATLANSVTFTSSAALWERAVANGNALNFGTSGAFQSDLLGGVDTSAALLAGTATANRNLTVSFSSLNPGAGNDNLRVSDVFHLTGTGSDIFVMQLQVDPLLLTAGSHLGWLDAGSWVNAIDGNSALGGSAVLGFSGSFASSGASASAAYLGSWGVDTAAGTAWAVLDHNSSFAIIPEPNTSALLLGAVGFALWFRRRMRKA